MRIARRIRFLAAFGLLLISVSAGACGQVDLFTGAYVRNHTDTAITIARLQDGRRLGLGEPIPPGSSITFGSYADGCSDVLLVALDPSGTEIARRDKMCAGDSWDIAPRPSASP
jgi:hypothetical protein